ncbi:LysR family transcriptional regulator [Agromyces sp. Marseille-P2726]|uniref:LysR family transcriptional regulator n=1 Tax=Agromyces sp. Marseille-P2726 TaxID=2709132 RepID=UPI001571486D|nr:LysR family transcriptional regulator [Agromyces sp. Marseille-P2726]
MIDVNRLSHAVAIAEHGTFGAAALALHMSQSALTRSIQSLESEFRVRLFVRGRAGAKLTPEGTRFIAQAEQLVRHAASVESDLRDISAGRDAAVNVGMGPISATLFLPRILEDLLGLTNQFPVRVKVGSNSELRYMLDAGELDFYVGGVPRESRVSGGEEGLRVDAIRARSRLALLTREGHPLLESPDDPDLRRRFPVVAGTFARDTSVGADVERHGFAAPAFVLDDYDLLADLVRRTDAVLLATELIEALRPEFGLRRLDIDVAPQTSANYGIVYSQAHRLSAAAQQVAGLVRETITVAYA